MIRFFRALWRLPAWMDAQSDYLNSIATRSDSVGRDLRDIHDAVKEATGQHKRLVEQQDRLRAFAEAVESAGVKRKYGGTIDVDYDKLLNALGPQGEREMGRTLKARRDAARRRLKVKAKP